jgi:phage-related minor tail protein
VADNFGLKIGIEGEKQFKNALREINQSFKVLGSEMNLVTSQFDKQDKSLQAITARNAVLNKEIDAQKEKISTLERALKNAAPLALASSW